ncbi:hypothetical protein RFI_39305, partial [Reticulomyxa filosa]
MFDYFRVPRAHTHRLEFLNQIEAIEPFPRWEEYPEEGWFFYFILFLLSTYNLCCDVVLQKHGSKGKFRLSKFKDFGKLLCDDDSPAFDPNQAYFVRGKFDVEMVLSEELELRSFPFD